jgi:thymidylate synthase
MHEDFNKNGMSDFMCTNNVQYLIRGGLLHAMVYMRSNDAVYGYKNDYAWQEYVQKSLLQFIQNKTGAKYGVGNIFWNVSSLHVYERHFELVK